MSDYSFTISPVTQESYTKISASLHTLGYGNEDGSEFTYRGVTLSVSLLPQDQTLTLTITKKPFFIANSMIEDKVREFIMEQLKMTRTAPNTFFDPPASTTPPAAT